MRTFLVVVSMALVGMGCAAVQTQSFDIEPLEGLAADGDVSAQLELGQRFDLGNGVRRNKKKAEHWYRMAAEAGNAEAQNSVGSMLQAQRKYGEAHDWYEKAAEQGHPQGTNNLAYLYDLGLGVSQDRARGKELYLKAANLGWGEAMWNLANMAVLGQVGPVDLYAGCVWVQRALRSEQAHKGDLRYYAEQGMQELRTRLAPEEIDRCMDEADQPLNGAEES